MTEAGLLKAHWESPNVAESQGRPRRRLYSVTSQGKGALAAAVRTIPDKDVTQQAFKPVIA